MRTHFTFAAWILAALWATLCGGDLFAADRVTLNFNPDWKFIKNDVPEAAKTDFDDRSWAPVSAPHTYNDVDTFDDWSLTGHRGENNQWGGRTWYRKTFDVPQALKGKKVYLEFEGVRHVAEVYLNGELLGTSKTGFIPFGFDLTPHLKFGQPNVLAVMCDNRFMKDAATPESIAASNRSGVASARSDPGPSGGLAAMSAKVNEKIPDDVDKIQADQLPWNNPHWHPAHGGIYRNVYLHVTDPLHISLPLFSYLQTAGPYVYANDITDKAATINLEVPVENGRSTAEKIEVTAQVIDQDGKTVATLKPAAAAGELAAGKSAIVELSAKLDNPRLWEPDYPHLYRVVCSLQANGQTIDTCEVPLGIRTVRWDKDTGFYINGHHVKLHGWGQKPTDEWPGLGAAQPDWLHFFTLNLMKEAGGNFVRWGHCAGGPALIAAADRLGIITDQPGLDGESDTVGAAWKIRAAAFRDLIIYYRNHPSILIWEGGNQKVTRDHAKELSDYVKQYDPHGGRAYAHRRWDKVAAEFMQVAIGTEGGRERNMVNGEDTLAYLAVVEGEYDREESPRRVWDDQSPPNFGYAEAKGQTYQLTSEQYAVNEVGQYVKKLGAENHCGGANWIFSDSTSGGRVATEVARASGEVDGVRLPKEAYYVCRTMFRSEPEVHIIGHWTYPADTKKAMYVVSNCDDVELFVNGKSLSHGEVSDRYLFKFPDVTWAAGEIKAVGYKNGKAVATQTKHTVGAPVALKITPVTGPGGLKADGSDVVLLDVEAVDEKGDRCPTFQKRVDFEVEGPGVWRGGYNSGKINSINNSYVDLECGINRVAVRSTRSSGPITVHAKSEGLKAASATVQASPITVEGGTSPLLPTLPTVALAKQRPVEVASSTSAREQKPAGGGSPAAAGRFIKGFSYSGPTAGAHVEKDAQDGKKIYSDAADTLTKLPDALKGADYVQVPNADKLYNAVDLMELAVPGGAVAFVAHDDRLARPEWLTKQFKPSDVTLTVDGQSMHLFQHRAEKDESLTLGTNSDRADVKACNMYVVFVNK